MSSARRQIAWGLVDQGLSSATNFGGSVLAARSLSAREFGTFSIGFAVYLIALGLSRAWSSDPLTIRYSAASEGDQNAAIRSAAGTAVGIGLALAGLLTLIGLQLPTTTRRTLLVVAVVLPGLLLQDLCRFALIMRRRSAAASFNDGIWLLCMITAFVVSTREDLSAPRAMFCWTIGAGVAAVVGIGQLRLVPSASVRAWIGTSRDLSTRYAAEFLLVTGTGYLVTVLLAALGGVERVAGFRGALVVLGPLNVIFIGLQMQATPAFVRRVGTELATVRKLCGQLSAVLGGSALVWVIVAFLLPSRLGTALLGDSWGRSRPLIPILGLAYVTSGATIGAVTGLRALGDARASLRARFFVAPVVAVLSVGGAVFYGPKGAAGGMLVGNLFGLPIWWRMFLRSHSDHMISGSPQVIHG